MTTAVVVTIAALLFRVVFLRWDLADARAAYAEALARESQLMRKVTDMSADVNALAALVRRLTPEPSAETLCDCRVKLHGEENADSIHGGS